MTVGGHLQFSLPMREEERESERERERERRREGKKESSPGSKCVTVTLSRNLRLWGFWKSRETPQQSLCLFFPFITPDFFLLFPFLYFLSLYNLYSPTLPVSFSISAFCFSPLSFTFSHYRTPQILNLLFCSVALLMVPDNRTPPAHYAGEKPKDADTVP